MPDQTSQAAVSMMHRSADLQDDPIRPEDVLSGDPRARARTWAVSADGTTSHWMWECTAGSFRWWFGFDETVSIVEGSVRVEVDGEEPIVLGVGDAAYFPAGSWSTWTVEEYVRKHAVLRVPVPRSMAFVSRVLGQRRYARA
ncbi:cupin domain-containing protein [Nocardioides sp.]|uniref:cupin domain-containing protein n=1 Tax=Nocardioides sp. TaxID=35761 RepID=UPI001A29F17B|nr:cupin domain-containing protein [Nocardioides sp.]MBJ7359687.1 DUF861 domain-containing protein [Nocardioides sp.]